MKKHYDIRGIILDIDGVLIGSTPGYNWPQPNLLVIEALKRLRQRGVFISLCTGKGAFAIESIVMAAHLDNYHCGDGGAVVVDVLQKKILAQHQIPTHVVLQVVESFQKQNIYLELYTALEYYIQNGSAGPITQQHTAILNTQPTTVDSLSDVASTSHIVKVMPVAKNLQEKDLISQILSNLKLPVTLQWGVHPTAPSLHFGIITAPGISKKSAAETISAETGVSFDHFLGVGDSLTDWEFIQLCAYGGAMGNASEELKAKVRSKPDKHFIIGPSVEKNGILEIFRYFEVI